MSWSTLPTLNYARLSADLKYVKSRKIPALRESAWWCCDMFTSVTWSVSVCREGFWICKDATFLIGTEKLGLWRWLKAASPCIPSFLVHYFTLPPSSKLISFDCSNCDPAQKVFVSRSFAFAESIFWLLHWVYWELMPNLSSAKAKVLVLDSSEEGCMPPWALGGLILFLEILFLQTMFLLVGICYIN